jgi:hypothetical protein
MPIKRQPWNEYREGQHKLIASSEFKENRNLKGGSISCKTVADFKYLLNVGAEHNCIHDEIQNAMNSETLWHYSNILIYIQQDATLHSLFYLETALHVSGGTSTHHQESKQLCLQHLVFVTPLLLPAAIVEGLELVWVCCGWRKPPTAHSKPVPTLPR